MPTRTRHVNANQDEARQHQPGRGTLTGVRHIEARESNPMWAMATVLH